MIDATPALRAYAALRSRRMDRQSPADTQRRQLMHLVRRARFTRFGRDHGFAEIGTVEDFQRNVPLRRYEQFWEEYWQAAFPKLVDVSWPGPIPYFAVTSGTTSGASKYIPVSREMVRSNRRAAFDLLVHHLRNRPSSRVFGGKNFMLGGTVDLRREAPGVRSGDLTGIAANEIPRWARRFTFPPASLTRETDWERKMATVGEASLGVDIRTIAGTASWLLLFFEQLAERHPGPQSLARFYPNLELLVHGGVDFAPYRTRFERWIVGSRAELREVYPASEGFVAIADRGPGEGLRLNIDGGLFYEFVPVEDLESPTPRRHWIADADTEREYAIVLSTCAGAWSYMLGDTVRFIDLDPPRLLVTGRTSYFLSAFGEHLSGEEIANGINAAADAVGASVAEFSVGPVFDAEGARGGHRFVVELVPPARLDEEVKRRFTTVLDSNLKQANADYSDHRADGFGMRAPEVLFAPPGTFAAWMQSRGKLGGQNKVPRVIKDQDLLEDLCRFAARSDGRN